MKENKISHRQLVKKDDAIAYLENMIKSLREGKIVIERNGQFVSMTAPDLMNMEISAKDKKDKNELCIELSWRKEPFVPDIAPLNITSEEPPAPIEQEKEIVEPAEGGAKKAVTPEKPNTETPAAIKTAPKTPPKSK
jgi:amphi-Trp domain-containing protein